jgi:hypothetical protein
MYPHHDLPPNISKATYPVSPAQASQREIDLSRGKRTAKSVVYGVRLD